MYRLDSFLSLGSGASQQSVTFFPLVSDRHFFIFLFFFADKHFFIFTGDEALSSYVCYHGASSASTRLGRFVTSQCMTYTDEQKYGPCLAWRPSPFVPMLLLQPISLATKPLFEGPNPMDVHRVEN